MMNIVLFGPPGAGKGTQSQVLTSHYGLVHISLGDLLRFHMAEQTPMGQRVQASINAGELIPDAWALEIMATQWQDRQEAGLLFDGFPRTVKQAEGLDQQLQLHHRQVDAVLFLKVPEEEVTQRIHERAKTSHRVDDQDRDKVLNRLRVYHEQTLPVTDYYAAQGKLYEIEGMGTVEEVSTRIVQVVDRVCDRLQNPS